MTKCIADFSTQHYQRVLQFLVHNIIKVYCSFLVLNIKVYAVFSAQHYQSVLQFFSTQHQSVLQFFSTQHQSVLQFSVLNIIKVYCLACRQMMDKVSIAAIAVSSHPFDPNSTVLGPHLALCTECLLSFLPEWGSPRLLPAACLLLYTCFRGQDHRT